MFMNINIISLFICDCVDFDAKMNAKIYLWENSRPT